MKFLKEGLAAAALSLAACNPQVRPEAGAIGQNTANQVSHATQTQDGQSQHVEHKKKLDATALKKGLDVINCGSFDKDEVRQMFTRLEAASSREDVRRAIVEDLKNPFLLNESAKTLFNSGYLTDADKVAAKGVALEKLKSDVPRAYSLSRHSAGIVEYEGAVVFEQSAQILIDKKEYSSLLDNAATAGIYMKDDKMKQLLAPVIAEIEAQGTEVYLLANNIESFGQYFPKEDMRALAHRILPKLSAATFLDNINQLGLYASAEEMTKKTREVLKGEELDKFGFAYYEAGYSSYITPAEVDSILAEKGWINREKLNAEIARLGEKEARREKRNGEYREQSKERFDALFR